MANPKLARQKQDAVDELIHGMVIQDIAEKVISRHGQKMKKSFLAHMRKKMPQSFKTLEYFKKRYPAVMQDLAAEFEREWSDD